MTYTKEDLQGMQFKHKDNSGVIYTITKVEDDKCYLDWKGRNTLCDYPVGQVLENFKSTIWRPLTQNYEIY